MLGHASTAAEQAAEAAIAAIPAWAGPTISYRPATVPVISTMHRSVDCDGFAVDVDGKAFFLKITHPEARPWVDVAAAFEAASAASTLGIAPTPRHFFPKQHAIVFDRLDKPWRTAMMHDLQNLDVFADVVTAKERLHARPIRTGLVGVRRHSYGASRAWRHVTAVASDAWWMLDTVADIEARSAAWAQTASPCHADGLASNIMIGPDRAIQLVDFDKACNTDPLYDTRIACSTRLPSSRSRCGRRRKHRGQRVRGDPQPLPALRHRRRPVLGPWATLMNADSQRRHIEFLKYANWRLLRCRMAIRDYGFERMLRAI